MRKLSIKKIALGVSASALMLGSSATWAQSINVAVAANFQGAMVQLVNAFGASGLPFSSSSFTVTYGATGDFQTAIGTALSAPGGTTPYDLFFAADDTTPAALRAAYSSVVQVPFRYAEGKLILWSKFGPNVSASGSAGFPNPASYAYANGQVAIANTVTAPYGTAAKQVLSRVNGIAYPGGAYDAKFSQYTTIGTTYTAVNASSSATTYPNMGFVAKSQVCNGSGAINPLLTGTYFEYTPATVNGNPPHDRLLQDAAAIRGRPGSTNAAVDAFIAYVGSTAGRTIIQNNCYIL
ncbi:substrate-binding domain-containing protein [Variovorax sp. 770b2]|uniref:substrate-binding domain-containing protein n=1 Tax=Variovorax sp. 770b2 TaxID=1566271 RepID=UPI0008E6F79F|nr:substrate-binding domain-containing protein [Variovorax sp. 770b2]SFP36655.1 molybdate transport system substrate-binding protein [Variovorax sp. 770b2]